MKDNNSFAETLRRVMFFENSLDELYLLRDEAFRIFHLVPLEEVSQIFKTAWEKLFSWDRNTAHQGLPKLLLWEYRDYLEMKRIVFELTTARINRKEFAEQLAPIREKVNDAIEKLKSMLEEEEGKLNELYNEFTQTTGDFKFIFESPAVKKLIMDDLLKS